MLADHKDMREDMNALISKTLSDYMDSLPNPSVYTDEHGVYQYLNLAYGNLIGLQQHLDFVGRTDFDLPCGAAACAEAFQEQDRQVMNSGKEHKILDIHPFAKDEMHVLLNSKKPWFGENKKIVGTLFQSIDITDAYTMAVTAQLAKFTGHPQNSYTLTDDGGALALTQRESEILFLVLRGKTAKLTASVLGLSYRTVQHYIESIREKFDAGSKIDLIDAAIARGYMNHIPVSVFSKQLSIVLAAE
jgi:DNA-binding CsgD family transcriptional regulator